jgi:hypothetical protein
MDFLAWNMFLGDGMMYLGGREVNEWDVQNGGYLLWAGR